MKDIIKVIRTLEKRQISFKGRTKKNYFYIFISMQNTKTFHYKN